MLSRLGLDDGVDVVGDSFACKVAADPEADGAGLDFEIAGNLGLAHAALDEFDLDLRPPVEHFFRHCFLPEYPTKK